MNYWLELKNTQYKKSNNDYKTLSPKSTLLSITLYT